MTEERKLSYEELLTLCRALKVWGATIMALASADEDPDNNIGSDEHAAAKVLVEQTIEAGELGAEVINTRILYHYFDDQIPHAETEEDIVAGMKIDDDVMTRERLENLNHRDAATWEAQLYERQHRLERVQVQLPGDSYIVRYLQAMAEEAEAGLHWARAQGIRQTIRSDLRKKES